MGFHGTVRAAANGNQVTGPHWMNTQERLLVVPATPIEAIRVKSIARKASFFYLARVFFMKCHQ